MNSEIVARLEASFVSSDPDDEMERILQAIRQTLGPRPNR
jgi:hypothetical protein